MFIAKIITPGGAHYEQEVERLSIPTTDGTRTLLAHHMDAVMPIKAGNVVFINKRDRKVVHVSDGIFNFTENTARLFVHHMDDPEAEE
ncbi:hypothetical protein [Allofustis seminis]|uniref:hypothetical protein n=1 Tax=Allofustis seminis TaxID=166939 RepID=UPI00036DC1CB|nr:hypothetical protein [Allofustis seminis]